MSVISWSLLVSDAEVEIDYSGCLAIGVLGMHSYHLDPEEGGMCQWCGLEYREQKDDSIR
jgi:hypothetical protein